MHSLQLEYLKELMNIAMGASTASIAELLDAFGTMHIPEVLIQTPSEFVKTLSTYLQEHNENYVSRQLFNGKFSGESLFLLNQASTENLSKHLYHSEEISEAEMRDSLEELVNILNATIIGKLTEELQTQVHFSVPSVEYVEGDHIFNKDELFNYHKIIMITTVMHFKDQSIEGKILILTKDGAIGHLLELIDRKLEELLS